MELHHKLRRDPNWHPNACNICGGMGHQAAQCKTGTIPWREVFGDEAFVVRKPVFWTEILAKRAKKIIDYEKLGQDAVSYARAACEAQVCRNTIFLIIDTGTVVQGRDYDSEIVATAAASQSIDTEALLTKLRADVAVKEEEAKIAADPTANLPPGWNVAYDPKGKPYYWHKETQNTQWEKPTMATPA